MFQAVLAMIVHLTLLQIVALENHKIPIGDLEGGVREMARIAVRLVGKVRATMPLLQSARAIFCVENNVIWIVDTFNKTLNEMMEPVRAPLLFFSVCVCARTYFSIPPSLP
jgi:hypothetical protein